MTCNLNCIYSLKWNKPYYFSPLENTQTQTQLAYFLHPVIESASVNTELCVLLELATVPGDEKQVLLRLSLSAWVGSVVRHRGWSEKKGDVRNMCSCLTRATSDTQQSTGQSLTRADRTSFLDALSSFLQPPREGSQPVTVVSVSISVSSFL